MTIQRNRHKAKTQLAKLLKRLFNGEEVEIPRAGQPVAGVIPIGTPPKQRTLGNYSGHVDDCRKFVRAPAGVRRAMRALLDTHMFL